MITFTLNNQTITVHPRDEADVSVFNEIFKVKEYRVADEVIKKATNSIVDVGAHAGFFTLYCRALNSKVKIFCIEPEKNNIIQLKKHLLENHRREAGSCCGGIKQNIKIIEGALAKETGKRCLDVSEDSHNHKLAPASKACETITQAFSFADFCDKNKIKKISLLKMDIEGGEYEVFSGMKEKDFAMVNFVILEYHNGSAYKQIENKLRQNGFGAQIFPSKYDKTMGFIFARNKRF